MWEKNKTISDGGITVDFPIIKVQILIDHWIAGDLVWIYCGPTLSLLWNHPDNNFLENLVQFEEDFNSGTKRWVVWNGIILDQFNS